MYLLCQRHNADGKVDAIIYTSLCYAFLAVDGDSWIPNPIMNIDNVMAAVSIESKSATMMSAVVGCPENQVAVDLLECIP